LSRVQSFKQYFPILRWAKDYDNAKLVDDSMASVIVAIMLVPQALALALIAGLPAQAGLYASIFGLSVYAIFGTSNTISVGPVAVLSLMTAAALGKLGLTDATQLATAALTLAFLSGIFLLMLGLMRLGFMANFLSHPVISAFITASAIIIGLSQMQHMFGTSSSGQNIVELVTSLGDSMDEISWLTLGLGLGSILIIIWCRTGLSVLLSKWGCSPRLVASLSRCGPVVVALLTGVLCYVFRLDEKGVQLLGDIPAGLPGLTVPDFSTELIRELFWSAILLSIIGFVESISVAQTLATKRREQIELDQELVGLGAANIAVSFSGGFPVCGGFSRSVVNYDAGAATPAAGLITAILIASVALLFTPLLYWLPKVALASIILVAVYPLLDFSALRKSWRYSKADFAAVFITLFLTLLVGVEIGIASGVLVSVLMHLYKTSQPHVAVIGRVPGTEHFRNVKRHEVETFDNILSIRIDESLYFANTRFLEELIFSLMAEKPKLEHVILMCTAVNAIDMSALQTLEKINQTLSEIGIKLHLSEVKGPIMDKLVKTTLFANLSGSNYLSHNQAVEDLKDHELPLSGI
jgi:sulfate permease, SulP family